MHQNRASLGVAIALVMLAACGSEGTERASGAQPAASARGDIPAPPTPVPTRPESARPPITGPTVLAHGGTCTVESETPIAQNEEPARGVGIAVANGAGLVAWPNDQDHVSVQRIALDGTRDGEPRVQALDEARGIHALLPIGEHFVLVTRGICRVRRPFHHCSTYLALDGAGNATGAPVSIRHGDQPRVTASAVVGSTLFVVLTMETGMDAASLSAPSFAQEILALTVTSEGVRIARGALHDPAYDGGDPTVGVLTECPDHATACGVLCAAEARRCTAFGIGASAFRTPIEGTGSARIDYGRFEALPRIVFPAPLGIPAASSMQCDGEGCDVYFHRGATARAVRVTANGAERPRSVPTDVSASVTDSPLRAEIEAGSLVRRDRIGRVVGTPLSLGAADARMSTTWNGNRFLVARVARGGGVTRYLISAIACSAHDTAAR